MKSQRRFLSPKQWELLRLMNPYDLDLSLKEAAKVLGISESAAKGRLKSIADKFPEGYKMFKYLKRKLHEKPKVIQYHSGLDSFVKRKF